MTKYCIACGNEYKPRTGREATSKWCSKQCFQQNYVHSDDTRRKLHLSHIGRFKGNEHPRYKGRIRRREYWYLHRPEHPSAGKQGYVAEHRLMMEAHLGRYLSAQEVVHHKNHIKSDNRIENLELCASKGQHTRDHHPEVYEKARKASLGRRPKNYNRETRTCPVCQAEFETVMSAHGKIHCSLQCCHKSLVGKHPKNTTGLLLGRGWNKGMQMTWALKGKEHHGYKHGRYSKYGG